MANVQLGRLFQQAEVELHHRLVAVLDVEFVLLQLVLDVLGVEAAVGNGRHHGVRDVADAAQTGSFQRQRGGGNVHAHATGDDGDQLFVAQFQAKVIYALHCFGVRFRVAGGRDSGRRPALE
ncbi:hypothetical protein D3C78_1531480 [compost metagenome]